MKSKMDAFIGRWVVFHKGHLEIIRKVYDKNKRTILILVMDTDEKPYAVYRIEQMNSVFHKENIPVQFYTIPPIASINWGRSVGYETNYIQVDEEIQNISGTDIRKKMANNDDSWKKEIP